MAKYPSKAPVAPKANHESYCVAQANEAFNAASNNSHLDEEAREDALDDASTAAMSHCEDDLKTLGLPVNASVKQAGPAVERLENDRRTAAVEAVVKASLSMNQLEYEDKMNKADPTGLMRAASAVIDEVKSSFKKFHHESPHVTHESGNVPAQNVGKPTNSQGVAANHH